MNLSRTTLLALVILAAFASALSAATILYGVSGGQLVTLDTTTGAGSLVGTGNYGDFPFALADYGGNRYTFNQTFDHVLQLSPTDGSVWSTVGIGRDLTGEGSMAFNSSGTLFLPSSSGFDGALDSTTLDRSSTVPGSPLRMDGLDFAADGTLYRISQTPDFGLYLIDPTDGTSTLIGQAGFTLIGPVLGFAIRSDSRMFAATGGVLYGMNPATGSATLIGNIGFAGVSGLTILEPDGGAIPEPAAWALTACGLCGLVIRRFRHA